MASVVPIEAYERAPDAFILVDQSGTIRMVNEPAAALLGCDRKRVIGSRCWEVVGLKTVRGGDWCRPDCVIRRRARSGESFVRFRAVHTRSGEPVAVEIFSTTVPPDDGDPACVLHMIVPRLANRNQPSRPAGAPTAAATAQDHRLDRLSPREEEILRALASGERTRAIARRLCLSPATVRNHIRSILGKLEVHRRLEAVLLWLGRADGEPSRPDAQRSDGALAEEPSTGRSG